MPKKSDKKVAIILKKTLQRNSPGSVIHVKKGYAAYLTRDPNPTAIYLAGNESIIEVQKQKWLEADQKQKEENLKIVKALTDFAVVIKRESGIGGAIYGSVSARDISKIIEEKLQETYNASIKFQSKYIKLNPIKALGDYVAKVNIGDDELKLPISIVGAA